MNLNPLFFNKIAKDSSPFNTNPSGGAGQTYLFADIINITSEELPDLNQLQNNDAVNLVLTGINNINIEIPVNEELLAELKQIITDSTPKIENINKEVYKLDDANITKTDNLINEETLLAFIAGLHQIIKPDVNRLGLLNNTNPNQPEVEYNNESPEDSLKDVLTLDTIQNVLDNNHSIKFTLRSLSEKITIQISSEDDNNIVNAEQALKNIYDYSKNVIAEVVAKQNIEVAEPIVSVGVTENEVVEESKPEPETNLNAKPETNLKAEPETNLKAEPETETEDLLPVNNEEVSSGVNAYKTESDNTKFKVEIVHSETYNANKTQVGMKIPFILDIKTSREIGEFLSKYNFENAASVDQVEPIANQAQDNTTQEIPENRSNTTEIKEEPKQSKLVFIKGSEFLDNKADLNLTELKRTSSEFLRAIKIENPEKINVNVKVNVLENNDNVRKVSEKKAETIKANLISEQEAELINDNSSDNIQNSGDKKKLFVASDQQKPEVEITNTVKREAAVNNKEENVVVTSKIPQVEQASKESESTLTSQSKVENVSVSDKPATGSNNFNKDEKEAKPEDQITDVKAKSEKIKSENKNSEEDAHQLKTVKDQVKHTDINNQPVFEKKAAEVNEIGSKILSAANSFKETVKKVKSTEIISEISKYLNTNEKQSITFQLTPKNLGTVKLTVDYVENAMQATIEVENEQIRQAVQSNIEQLKTTLQNNGIQLSNLDVNLSNGEPKAHKQFASKKKSYNTNNESKVEQQGELTGKKKLGYNTYEYLV
ncbi:MAG: hypothetical protein GYA14_02330 [Ignavibacteria bacterium]|nr:hypothetical protein [Ignavibacteria bacterium]